MDTNVSRRGWKQLRRIGGGCFSDVYLVSTEPELKDPNTTKIYAVKMVDPDDLRPPHNLKNEIKILFYLKEKLAGKCKNVITLLDTLVDGAEMGLIFEYYDFTLKNILEENIKKKTIFNTDGTMSTIKKNEMSFEYVKTIMTGICNGVFWIHKNGIIHRDLNLNNILISSTDKTTPVIIDFGIAYQEPNNNDLETWNQKFTDIATGFFKAPELLLSKRDYTNKVDMWAIGIILSILVHEMGECCFEFDAQHSDLVLLSNILVTFGSPPQDWSDCKGLESFDSMNAAFFKKEPKLLKEYLPRLEEDSVLKSLFIGLTQYETQKRLSADQCLKLLS